MGGPKLTSLVLSPLGIILAILFFLPWVNLECTGPKDLMHEDEGTETKTVGHATGWQLATGDLTPYDKDTGKPYEDQQKREKAEKEADETIQSRPWFFLGLLVPILLLVVGVGGLTGLCRCRAVGLAGVVLAALGVLVVLLVLAVDYEDDFMDFQLQKQREAMEKAGTPEGEIKEALEKAEKNQREEMEEWDEKGWGPGTSARWPVWASLVLYVAAGAVAVMGLLSAPAAAGAPAPIAEQQPEPPVEAQAEAPDEGPTPPGPTAT